MGQTIIKETSDGEISRLRDKYGNNPGSRIYVFDNKDRILGYFPKVDLDKDGKIKEYIQPLKTTITSYTRLSEALSEMLSIGETSICVVNDDNKLIGIVHLQDIVNAVGSN
jgi:Mg/Co/Ni transporter MgtE